MNPNNNVNNNGAHYYDSIELEHHQPSNEGRVRSYSNVSGTSMAGFLKLERNHGYKKWIISSITFIIICTSLFLIFLGLFVSDCAIDQECAAWSLFALILSSFFLFISLIVFCVWLIRFRYYSSNNISSEQTSIIQNKQTIF